MANTQHSTDSYRDERHLSNVFRALSDVTRQEILRLLESRSRTAGEIVAIFTLPQSTILRHLAILKEASLVAAQRQGRTVTYRLNEGALSAPLRQFFGQFRSAREVMRPEIESHSDVWTPSDMIAGERSVILVSASDQLRAALARDLELVYRINAEQLELLVCDRLDVMGFEVRRVGHTFASDGGVDIVCWPKKSDFPYLMAVQVKHSRKPSGKVGPGPVKDLLAVMQTSPFDAGVLVTNTSFTPNAKWFARHGPRIVKLRDLEDLRRWIAGNFLERDLQDFPSEIELAPGVRVRIR